MLEKLLVAGLQKIRNSERHGFPLTELVDPVHDIFELRVGKINIARIFFFQPNREIVVTNDYVKKQPKADPTQVARATLPRRLEGTAPMTMIKIDEPVHRDDDLASYITTGASA